MHIVAFLAFFGTTIKVIAFLFDPSLGFFTRYVSDPDAYIEGLTFVFAFVLMTSLGYVVAGPRRRVMAARFGEREFRCLRTRVWFLPLSLGVIFLVMSLLLAQRGLSGLSIDTLLILNSQKQFNLNEQGVGSTGALVKTLYTFPRVVFVVAVMVAVHTRRTSDQVIAVLIALALLASVPFSGDRFDLMRLAGYALIGAVLAGWRGSLRSGIVLTGGVAAIVALAGFMSVLRQGDTLATSAEGPLAELSSQILSSTYFLDVNVVTILMQRIQEQDYMLGESYMVWTYGWIPRTIWPEKPAVDVGVLLKQIVLGSGRDAPGGVNATGPGEAYLNFGNMGVLVGIFLGALFRRAEIFLLRPSPGYLRRMLYYPSSLFLVIQSMMQSSFSGVLTAMFAIIPLTWVVARLLFRDSATERGIAVRSDDVFRRSPKGA